VYGRPAIALPLAHLRTRAQMTPQERGFHICAPDIHAEFDVAPDNTRPLAILTRRVFEALDQAIPSAVLTVNSDIPPGSHLGSSASVAVACARAMAAYGGHDLTPAEVSALAFEAEQVYHGSPSGIDNTVVAYEQPVWFVRGEMSEVRGQMSEVRSEGIEESSEKKEGAGMRVLDVALPLLVIGDTGVVTPTRIPVGDVRQGWLADRTRYERLFDQIADVAVQVRDALHAVDWPRLGALLDANQALLQELGVSSPELDALCAAAWKGGALGAKLSGGGRGGNMIALARDPAHAAELRAALQHAGAARVI
jgi:mevalonate kinase